MKIGRPHSPTPTETPAAVVDQQKYERCFAGPRKINICE